LKGAYVVGSAGSVHVGVLDRCGLWPEGGLARGKMHEVLWQDPGASAVTFAAVLLRAAAGEGTIAWFDAERRVYPPGLLRHGIDPRRLLFLRVREPKEILYALAECLACDQVAAVVATPPPLSTLDARKLQLAAEHGNALGLFLRPFGSSKPMYAPATQWVVGVAPGGLHGRRMTIERVHGRGGRVLARAVLEVCDETNTLRPASLLADRPLPTPATGT
jgi:protein ImuA